MSGLAKTFQRITSLSMVFIDLGQRVVIEISLVTESA